MFVASELNSKLAKHYFVVTYRTTSYFETLYTTHESPIVSSFNVSSMEAPLKLQLGGLSDTKKLPWSNLKSRRTDVEHSL